MDLIELHTLAQRQEARIRELELWLAMMAALTGRQTPSGWQLRLGDETVALLRKLVPSQDPAVAITADGDNFYIDVI